MRSSSDAASQGLGASQGSGADSAAGEPGGREIGKGAGRPPDRGGAASGPGRRADQVHLALRRAVLFRDLVPGDHLLEQTLAAEHGCSQGTVREALLRLSEEGLVERRGYRGTVVTETSLPEAAQMVRVRLSIERGVALRIAAGEAAMDDPRLPGILAAMDEAHAAGDLYRCSELDRDFHAALAEVAGMGLLRPMLLRCALHIHRYTLGGLEVPRPFFQEAGVGDEHRALLADLRRGDAAVAARAMADHLARVLTRWAPSLHAAAGGEAAFRGD
ncbi:GntR family transcriptional regulator [Albimonas sp. CAU 1670]|uniref:GntR family transcriptional regulator n=1 Tax=Albimonas sp. CAU 1670 TaxID=3032599 RepID=UPI0023DA5EA4|nr:GntR family transcriptional regulator [Albimonas sp. CAU 1670]MDF2235054.1 GntR family transcriptional regulator [Albimonas sp. CAU 1670]